MDYLQDFLSFVQYVHGRSDNTVNGYRWDLSCFLDWVKLTGHDVTTLRPVDIDEFFIFLRKEKENTAKTVNRKRSALNMFYRWLLRKELISKNPMDQVSRMKEPSKLPHYLTPPEQEALILAAQNGDAHHLIRAYSKERAYLLILLLLDCGLRIQEACSLKVEDVNLEEGVLKVKGKGQKERIAILSDRLKSAIEEYLNKVTEIDIERKVKPGIAARGLNLPKVAKLSGIPYGEVTELIVARREGRIGAKRDKQLQTFINEKVRPLPLQYLLFNRGGRPLNTRQAFRIVRDIGRRVGVEIHPHLLRHSFAVNLRRKGADSFLLREALGHASVLTTQIYCGFTDGEFKNRMKELIN